MYKADVKLKISIHAPVKGATSALAKYGSIKMNFNPRSREGSDVPNVHLHLDNPEFQSTLP